LIPPKKSANEEAMLTTAYLTPGTFYPIQILELAEFEKAHQRKQGKNILGGSTIDHRQSL